MYATPKLSILTTVHNIPEEALRLSLTASLAQTIPELELIVIADSTSYENKLVITEFAKKDQRVRALTNETSIGYGRSLNLALSVSSGDYIGIVDGDDFVDNNFYQVLLSRARSTASPIAKGNCVLHKNGVMIKTLDICDDVAKAHYKFSWQHWSAIYSRKFLTENGILWFPETRKNTETLFLTKAGVFNSSVPTVNTVYYNYCRRPDSMDSDKLSEKKLIDSARVRLKSVEFTMMVKDAISNEHCSWNIADAITRLIIESSRAETERAYEAAARGVIAIEQAVACKGWYDNAAINLVKANCPGLDVSKITDYLYLLSYMKGQRYVDPV